MHKSRWSLRASEAMRSAKKTKRKYQIIALEDIARTLSLPLSLCVRSTVERAYCLLQNSFVRLDDFKIKLKLPSTIKEPRVY